MSAILVIILIGLYFIPVIVATIRSVPNVGSVFVVNFFLGWTFLGWVVALAMACRSQPTPHQVVVQQVQGTPAGPAPDDLEAARATLIAERQRRETLPPGN